MFRFMIFQSHSENDIYDVEVDVFSFGVMLVHVLNGQWPIPSEASQVDPNNSEQGCQRWSARLSIWISLVVPQRKKATYQ